MTNADCKYNVKVNFAFTYLLGPAENKFNVSIQETLSV